MLQISSWPLPPQAGFAEILPSVLWPPWVGPLISESQLGEGLLLDRCHPITSLRKMHLEKRCF